MAQPIDGGFSYGYLDGIVSYHNSVGQERVRLDADIGFVSDGFGHIFGVA